MGAFAILFWLLAALPLAVTVAGLGFQAVGLIVLRRFFATPPVIARSTAAVTILKPLHGDEPRLAENLASFLAQDHAGPLQIVCGVANAADAAVPAARELAARTLEATLVIDPTRHGSNGKVGNLTNMMRAATGDVIVQSDSDMAVPRDYVDIVLAALARPGVGAVTCLYRGRGDAGLWSRLAAGTISYLDLPAILIGHVGKMATPCMGSTIALRRETLAAIGGFARFADVLADDYAIGQAVLAQGHIIAIPPLLLIHGCADASFGALWRHQSRWAATVRDLRPLSYLGLAFTNPLPWALLATLAHPRAGALLVIVTLAIRALLAGRVDRIAGARSAPLWLLPVIDCLAFAVFLASFATRRVDWRGARLTMATGGRIDAR